MRQLLGGLLIAVCMMALAGPARASAGAFAWGKNEVGQLGDGTTLKSSVPAPISGLSGISALAGGRRHGLALLGDGTVMAWGENNWGQLGVGTSTGPGSCTAAYAAAPDYTVACSTTPVPVEGLSGVVAIAAGAQHSLALLSNGTVMAWGANGSGQLGDGSTWGPDHCDKETESVQCSTRPVQVSGLSEVKAIAAGQNYSLALLQNGTVVAWGELGNGSSGGADATPTPVEGLSGVTAISAGDFDGLALLNNGTVMAWGDNKFGQLGDGTLTQSNVPVAVSGLSGVSAIAMGEETGFALGDEGTVEAWGSNISGQLGIGLRAGPSECFPLNFCSPTPVEVDGIEHATAIAAGGEQTLALLSDGAVMSWGLGWEGQMGDGSTEISDVPVTVSDLSHVTSIAAGDDFSFAYGVPGQPPPLVTRIAPNAGAPTTTVTIIGSNLSEVTAVKFGSANASGFELKSDTEILAVAPPGTGTVDVTVETLTGASATSPADRFTYDQPVNERGSAGASSPSAAQSVVASITQVEPTVQTSLPKPLTRSQKLAAALKACRRKPKGKRASCERRARKSYAPPRRHKRKLYRAQ